jgi:hypothetical protein
MMQAAVEAQVALADARVTFYAARAALDKAAAAEVGIDRASVSFFWGCQTSPVGGCIYDDDADPCHDFCLFCDDPEERK